MKEFYVIQMRTVDFTWCDVCSNEDMGKDFIAHLKWLRTEHPYVVFRLVLRTEREIEA